MEFCTHCQQESGAALLPDETLGIKVKPSGCAVSRVPTGTMRTCAVWWDEGLGNCFHTNHAQA